MSQTKSIPTEQEWNEWLQHPVTQAFRRCLQVERERLHNVWEAGQFSGETSDETAALNIMAAAEARLLGDMQQMDYSDLIHKLGEDE